MRLTRIAGALLLVASCAGRGAHIYDPHADAWKQLEAAGRRAGDAHKRVLVVIGGDW
jgi:hypothetical protein